ncbi:MULTISPECIES: ABC transporter ATP-binding protein [unclassified Solwaraspora]|uniref:ABC transporter ATP-binding protein n=1 Tax=unclassified Solwaraspora TaxID=2627926 RepID=UPI00259B5CD4|nr:ABC transporter ATP-binding protein [Solwaraspora sp. WMMA2056]WJK38631.1 ABC transporter ATP-binding protein [Solwaraspora sp. WMMA2056]
MIGVLRVSARILATSWRLDRRKTFVSVVLMLAGAAAAPMLAVVLGVMTNAVVTGRTADATVAGVAAAALVIASLTFSHFAHVAYFELSELAELDFDEQLLRLSNGSVLIDHHEQPDQADALTVLQQESRQFRTSLESLMNGLGLSLAIVLTGILLAWVNPVLLLLPLAAVPPLVAGRIAERIRDASRTATAEPTRVALNLFHLATSATHAGELRVFRLAGELRDRHARLWDSATRRLWRAHLTGTAVQAAGQLIFALGYVGAVLLVVRDAITGQRAIGDIVLVIVLAVAVNQQVTMAVTLLQDLQRMASAYRRLADFRATVDAADRHRPVSGSAPTDDLPAPVPAQSALVTQPAPTQRLTRGIEFADVSFSYPGTDVPVLRDVRLTLPAGARVAIVGENGAGKTSLIKLLCGFYRPTGGRILVDGVDLAAMDTPQWWERISVGFQDFARYEFDLQHAVGLGDLPQADSPEAVHDALVRAQARSVLTHLPDGLRTQLGKSYADGAELSGGQWQRLALGRAMMRRQPLLLVLDEPASAMDPAAEHALFERYADQAVRVAEASGAITVFVSHRFSTVRMADLIVVLRDGRVAEVGTHSALLADSGLYAELFTLQAEAYR